MIPLSCHTCWHALCVCVQVGAARRVSSASASCVSTARRIKVDSFDPSRAVVCAEAAYMQYSTGQHPRRISDNFRNELCPACKRVESTCVLEILARCCSQGRATRPSRSPGRVCRGFFTTFKRTQISTTSVVTLPRTKNSATS